MKHPRCTDEGGHYPHGVLFTENGERFVAQCDGTDTPAPLAKRIVDAYDDVLPAVSALVATAPPGEPDPYSYGRGVLDTLRWLRHERDLTVELGRLLDHDLPALRTGRG